MKPTAALLACTLVAALPLGAQNLVPNPSFEDYTDCPDNPAQIERATNWRQVQGSPEYLNMCSAEPWASVPTNRVGYQLPHAGLAYAGLIVYSDSDWFEPPELLREVVGIELSQPLSLGIPVSISFWVAPAAFGMVGTRVKWTTNGIGARFVMGPLSLQTPQAAANDAVISLSPILSDTADWTLVSGSCIPDSAYTCLLIGNFISDPLLLTATIDPQGTYGVAYVYLDDVCVSPNPNGCVTAEGIEDPHTNTLQLHPNPATDHVVLTSTKPGSAFASVMLLDASGRSMPVQVERNAAQQVTLRWAQPLAPGVYVVRAALKSGERFTERVVVE